MIFKKWWLFACFIFCDCSTAWLDERPLLESINGNLHIFSAKDKNITLKTVGDGYININDINLLQTVYAAQDASRLIERWKNGILDDVESTLQRLTRIVEGPNGLVRKISAIEINGDSSFNSSSAYRPSSDREKETETSSTSNTAVQVKSISNRLKRLENKVRTVVSKLRTNECASDPCQNGGTCIDKYDSFQCHCPPEWEGTFCTIDVNECERLSGKPFGCQNGATCVNLPGSFSCTCPSGWHGFHCTTQKSVCDQSNDAELCGNGVCIKTNSPLGYTCLCKPGWDHLGENDPSCRKDIDECTTSRYPCSVNPLVTCHNVPGTFYCGVCPAGYSGDGFKCQDIDECLVNNGGCSTSPLVECINTLGSRKCGGCPRGYQGDGITCFYVGSCSVNNGGCHSLATCREGPDAETLCICPSGYGGSGKGPDGCKVAANGCKANPCVHGTCSPQGDYSFTCTCSTGYTGLTCNIPTDACSPNPCQNNGVCRTVRGRRVCICSASFTGPTCGTAKQVCGGFFRSPEGYVEFPVGTGNKYDHGLSCAWVVITNHTMVLNVTFTRFALESARGDECKHDYVQIHDGRSAGSHILGRYCGNKLPNNGTIVSTHNSLYIWFHSDSTVNSDGFAFNWTSVEPVCGGDINADYGSISSPGFPGKYPASRDCYWNIIVTPGKRIVLHFISLMLEVHPTCENDYLEINETGYAGQHLLGRYCNHTQPEPITTSGPRATVHFHSDNSGSDNGFHLSFISIAGAPDCGGVFTSESGEISSPGFHSGSYRGDMICDWEIRLPNVDRVSIKFLTFDIESSRNCMFDSVQIYSGPDTNSPLAGRYCGTTIPATLSIKSSRILIRFECDSSLESQGFALKYEVECGGVFTEPSGILKSPFYPNYYPASKDCIYLISQPPGKAIVLTFEYMDIEEGSTFNNETECYFDKLVIRDGDTENSTLLTTLCGPMEKMPTSPIYSTNNYMHLEFITDSNIHNHGFKANYTTIDRECGGIFRTAPGTINIPGVTGKYVYKLDCLWTIRAPPNHAVQLTWISFPSTQSSITEECVRNFLELFESYGSPDSKSLGKYCPIKPPPQIMTTQENELTLRYLFNGDLSDNNYQATYIFINDSLLCGGYYYTQTGYVRSPNFPAKYPKNKECVWVIQAKNKYLVTAKFSFFDLEKSPKCGYDYVEIRSGSQGNSPLIGKFCGSEIPEEITSMTNQMYIKFVSDSSLQKGGFEFQWRSTKSGCGGSLRSSSGSIISPNYPQNYYHRATCTWNVRVSAGSVVGISFIDFDIEDHVKCSFDYLEISDVINGYVQNTQRFCGSISPPHFLSKSNQIKVVFRSDVLTSTRGFHMRYTTECHNKVSGFRGVIESPNFPQTYENLSNCSWTISVPPGNKINMTFSHFNIEKSINGSCYRDYVRIQEGDDDSPNTELVKTCGSEEEVLPLKLYSTQRQVFVSFISGRYSLERLGGFRLEWYVNGCSKYFSKPTGRFTSPGYPYGDKLSHSYVECEWLIEVNMDKSIELTFPTIDNSKSHDCTDQTNSIDVYNGIDENAPKLTHNLCYSDKPVVITSTGNHLFIKYLSYVNYASHGFVASYRSIGVKCGGIFTGQSGAIHSANYPKNYPHNQNCEWLITVDPNHAINLTFVDLDLEKSRNCSDDYIKIYDGNATEAPLLGKHCESSDELPSYISTGNQILVTMRTDPLISAKGFKAYYNRTCGARILVDGQGLLRTSPSLHTSSIKNCSWILTAKDPGDKITLSFTHVDLFETDDCSYNHIEVYEGEGTTGPLLGQICYNKIPTPFYSTGNALTVHFTSAAEYFASSIGDTFDAVYSTFSSTCGGQYTAESGTFASPNYPLSYPTDADCVWIIGNSPGNRVTLSFNDFELLANENCDTDYVEVRENDGIGKLRGTFCGKDAESITSSNPLWIRFKSAKTTIANPKGFEAEYQLLHGDELIGDTGEITSPMYPIPFRKGDRFSWRITVEFNYVIKLQFIDLYLESYDDYCYSSLKIYDGYNDEAPELKELCGMSVPYEEITSSGNIMFLELVTAADRVGSLFRLKWIKIPRKTNTEETQEISNTNNTNLIILTERNKTHQFSSPGYPDGYDNNLKYSWTFVSPRGTHLVLKFLTMNIEDSEDCITDYVAIYNGYVTSFDTKTNLISKVCLANSTLTNFRGTNVMTVQFVTDSYQNKTGFLAMVLSECGGIIEESNGVIALNNSLNLKPRAYIYTCEWVVKVRPGRRINVKVLKNSIESSQSKASDNACRSNYLMLKNGESANSPLLGIGKYCNSIKPEVQNTSSNYLYVKLAVSFASVNFKLVFKELGHDCGGNFQLSAASDLQQEISSPNYPNIPTPHTECTWTFMSPDEHLISIHFLDRFDLAFSADCEKEYVEIRDGGTDTSPLLGRYCQSSPPSSVATKGNIMYVHYYTDIPEPRNGFKAIVTSGDVCGGIEREPNGGVITSPNYPESYDVKTHFCSWWIIAPTSNRGIKLQFEDLDLPNRRNCTDTDHVSIYEKLPGSFNNTKIDSYCGKNRPGVIDILTSEAMIIFETLFTNPRIPNFHKGFKLNYTFNHEACGGTFSGMSGEFQTTGYPRPTTYKYCNWKITVPEGYQVVLDIIDVDLNSDRYVMGSHVSFHHDPDSLATIALMRESTRSKTISSSSNYMSVYYISADGHRGMKAKYTAKAPAPCGGVLSDWEGTLTNPRMAPFNESAYYCKWIVNQPTTLDPSETKSMTFTAVIRGQLNRRTPTASCRYYLTYISIKGEKPVAKVCGNMTKQSVTVSSPYKSHVIEAINATQKDVVNFTLTYKWQKCGGILTGPSHVIQTPKNISYPVHCAWKVIYPDFDNTILVTFAKLNLGPCDKSYILVKGKTYRSPLLGKFCGNEKPQNIVSPTNEITIEYHADEDHGDFEIHLDPAEYGCGGVVKGKTTQIRSPGFPKSYPNNTECTWIIMANTGYHIGLTFVERFNLETSKNCQNDYVEVFEWTGKLQNGTDNWNTLGRSCGRIPPEKPFNITTNKMMVKFVSNEKIEGEGFKAVWSANCGGVYKVSEIMQYIESPNYFIAYPSNAFCNYTLIANKNEDIIVEFTDFSLEGTNTACPFDNVTITFYSGEWVRGQNTWCGTNSPGRKMSSERMEIIFRSDNSVNRAGFRFKYYTNDCGGYITKPRIISPLSENDPDSYGYVNCIWVVEAPSRKSVLLRFEEFNITQTMGSCVTNYVRVFEGNSTQFNHMKGTFCGNLNSNLPVIQSLGNKMTIMFHASSYGHTHLLKAAVLFVNSPEAGCGGNINITHSRQFKTQPTENYDPFQDCHWLISAPQGYSIQFTINEMDLKKSYNSSLITNGTTCVNDYIEIRDGGPYAQLIGRYCGHEIPAPMTSTANLLWIRFVSDGTAEGHGVKGTLESVISPCGLSDLSVGNESKILTSPQYPDSSPSDITCRWYIHANSDGSRRLRIVFEEFNLEESENCEAEYLQIADMNNREIISEGFGQQLVIGATSNRYFTNIVSSRSPQSYYKYCGAKKPHDYYSNYKDIELIYKASAGRMKKKGFKLEYTRATCSRNYTELQGRIVHESVTDCWVTIQVPANYKINMYFNNFFLPGSSDCSQASMQIRDGGFDGHLIQSVCNYETPNPVFSTGNRISIYTSHKATKTFYSNSYDITYTSTDKGRGCGGEIFNYGGVFTSPFYPNPYRNRSNCVWDVSVPRGMKISLSFDIFDIGPRNMCETDYLTVSELQSNGEEDVRRTHCGGDTPANYDADSNRVLVTYATSVNNGGSGWVIHFTTL